MSPLERHLISPGMLHFGNFKWLKKEIIMHDKIGFMNLEDALSCFKLFDKSLYTDLTYLINENVVYEAEIPSFNSNPGVAKYIKQANKELEKFGDHFEKVDHLNNLSEKDRLKQQKILFRFQSHLTRAIALDLQLNKSIAAIPLFIGETYSTNSNITRPEDVMRVVLKQLPIPDDTVPLQDILDLRNDPEFIKKRDRLWSWTRETASKNWDFSVISDEMRIRSQEYSDFMTHAGIKTRLTAMGLILKSSIEFIQNLKDFNLTKLTEPLFSISTEKANLNIAELTAPGKELALIPYLESKAGFIPV